MVTLPMIDIICHRLNKRKHELYSGCQFHPHPVSTKQQSLAFQNQRFAKENFCSCQSHFNEIETPGSVKTAGTHLSRHLSGPPSLKDFE
ncbi:hypothetical protein CEXT_514451 [Caerostris extrusa]|uniref:Uncharacterized protein n=1 Tax=Caerostris extrusa TaxID=172846 RepID=A0AAV4T9I5_CAEEX|nr:hypothetical protein CEXT_514451 [Caerostris extrusa]